MATLFDSASLAMIPSGYKDDKLYSIKPTDGSGDFTFSRDGAGASPATRVNASGLIEKGRENLILQSNTFDTTWLNAATTETGGQSGYDGTNDAWLITRSSAAAYIYQTIATTDVVTLSIYAKAGSLNWFLLACNGGTGDAYFDLANGAIGIANGIDAKIESVGGGWYRCSVTSTGSMNAVRIFPAQGNGDVGGSTGNIYIQDAQLESGLVATDYIETTTAPVSAGLLGDMPRLDYSGGATCGSLLLEPSRVNLLANSEYFGSWTAQSGVSTTANSVTSPEGLQNAYTIQFDDNTASQFFSYASATSGTIYTTSVFIKYKSGINRNVRVGVYDSGHKAIIINFATDGTIDSTSTSGTLVDSGYESYGNGWYRVYIVHTGATTGNIEAQINRIGLANTTEEFYIYGSQLEAGSYPTSYIPTYGAASTRGADVCNKTSVPSLIGTTESSIFLDVVFNGLANTSGGAGAVFPLLLEAGAGGERAQIVFGSDRVLAVTLRDNSSLVSEVASATNYLVEGTRYKIGIAYSLSGLSVYVNGSLLGTDSVPSLPTLENIYLNDYRTTALYQGGLDVNQAVLFKTRLTNAELASLTTL